MRRLELIAVPNQQFTVNLDNRVWDITIKENGGNLMATISVNGERLISSGIVLNGQFVIPFPRLSLYGNLFFTAPNNMAPNWRDLGKTQHMYYMTLEEMEALDVLNPVD